MNFRRISPSFFFQKFSAILLLSSWKKYHLQKIRRPFFLKKKKRSQTSRDLKCFLRFYLCFLKYQTENSRSCCLSKDNFKINLIKNSFPFGLLKILNLIKIAQITTLVAILFLKKPNLGKPEIRRFCLQLSVWKASRDDKKALEPTWFPKE